MGKYIKKFDTHSSYEDFIETEDFIKPNVSYCVDNVEVHYSSVSNSELIARYNVEDASEPTQLYMYMNQQGAPFTILGADMFSKVEIDGTEVAVADLDTAQGQYQLSAGEHTVKYTLIDPTFIGVEMNEPRTITRLGTIFSRCSNIISVEIPDSVISIGDGTFSFCGSLTSITIPDSVTSIGASAFQSCTSLTSITIPDSVTNIGQYAFNNCISLTSITIPNNITSIGENAFENCDGLTSVTIEATTPPTLGNGAFASSENYPIWVPAGTANTYKAASGWIDYASRIYEIGEGIR